MEPQSFKSNGVCLVYLQLWGVVGILLEEITEKSQFYS